MPSARGSLALVVALAGICTAACQPQAEPSHGEASSHQGQGSRRDLPVVAAVFTWESLQQGQNMARKNYLTRMESCHQAGWPAHELSSEEQARLGTGQVEVQVDATRQRVRQTTWTLGATGQDPVKGMCLASLEEHVDERSPDDTDGMFQPLQDDHESQDMTAKGAGWSMQRDGQVRGIACTQWSNGRQETCMWSGGRQWGFDDGIFDGAGCEVADALTYLTSIPLAGKPLDGTGCAYTLQSFSINKGAGS